MNESPYITDDAEGLGWKLMLGDSCERLSELEDESIDMSIFSPPFASLFTYSPSQRDLGNSSDRDEFFEHFGFITKDLLRVTKVGRLACVHVQQLTTTKATHGYNALTDFRGQVIAHFQEHGWWMHGEVTIDKDPQVQAIRTKAHALMFKTLRADSSRSRPGLADYLIIFKKPGESEIPIIGDVSNETWITWARPVWYDIRESDTLNTRVARDDADERHICPLQLPLIERCVRLWSNKGDTVLSPFAGIGSEGVVAIQQGRRFIGCELKPSYWETACHNLRTQEGQTRIQMVP